MKVLLFDTTNAFLTPGGKTTHAIKLQQELSLLNVDIQFAKWWDKSQEDFDIIHFLTPNYPIARLSQKRGKKTFLSLIFDYESNKSPIQQTKTILKNKIINLLPQSLTSHNAYWKSFQFMDKIQFMHEIDRNTALKYFPNDLSLSKTIIIPHAYDPNDMNISDHLNIKDMNFPDKYLISCANISPRKQSILLASLAQKAQTPIVFLGNATPTDPYFQRFKEFIDNKYVFYPGYVTKEWKDCIEKNASGFVLLSQGESGCIAVYEAAAYNIPLLLSNLPWAWGYESPKHISYCDIQDELKAITQLQTFYQNAHKLSQTPFTIHTWKEVALLYKQEYERILM